MMHPTIIEGCTDIGIDIGSIVRRIIFHLPPKTLEDLQEVRLLDAHKGAFACYKKTEHAIEIYVANCLGDFPRIALKLLYPLAYLFIGMALAHELDHHVNRNRSDIDREASAEANLMKYIFPSLGVFKPAVRIMAFLGRPFHKALVQRIERMESG